MQDLGLNGKRVAICGKGSTSFLGFSWRRCQNFSSALACFVEDVWVTQNLGALVRGKTNLRLISAISLKNQNVWYVFTIISLATSLFNNFFFFSCCLSSPPNVMCVYMCVIYLYISIHLSMYLSKEKWAKKIHRKLTNAEIQMTTKYWKVININNNQGNAN